MQSESSIDKSAAAARVRGGRRKRGSGSVEGPVFVDNSGRRAKVLRRIGLLVGVVCLGYAAVLGMAFMGWGTSLTPSALLPFGGGGRSAPGGGFRPGGGPEGVAPTGRPTDGPSGRPTGVPPAGVRTVPSASASSGAN
ncbi:hypothetical protein [Streptomyces gibsoniae]|uniref:Uncharacterized protein n=1 Tax=Streptomyces gibsoniae TaxID=3075529 RepID=A0ABU2U7J0_9ACTN|nr:hypothetical protein [Streptomyces sp. DSM 41699]MDT0469192.1 hypothetical protein [Streptomyces sp. DSM 41699]